MGCSASRLEDEEAVQLCKDRRNFIKQAVEQRIRFASGHIAYIQSLKRVSLALQNYVAGDEHYDLFSDSFTNPPFTPVKRLSPEIKGMPLPSSKSSPPTITTTNESVEITYHASKYMRSGQNPSVSVKEWPQSPAAVRVDSYYSTDHYGIDGFFATQASPLYSSYNRPSYPPASPQDSQWDFFWNPFSSLDTYGYPYRSSFDRTINDDDMAGLRQVREEEGIPELEEEGGGGGALEEEFVEVEISNERYKAAGGDSSAAESRASTVHEVKEFQSKGLESIEVSEAQNAVELEVTKEKEVVVGKNEAAEETPGFTVYLNKRPTSMAEVMKDIENQFVRICDCAHEISVMLEASRAHYSSTSSEIAVKMLNPVALFRSASSRSTSSRFFHASSSGSRDDGYESSSDFSEESCMISGSHQSTLDRLYAWEKKLYEEVKAGERVRIAFEKRYMQLSNQDVNGEEPYAVDKTRAAIRLLHTQLKVALHSVESVSKRIETLRDEEMQPQLIELIQGLARMWGTMADCHRTQKRTIDEAKLLLVSSPAAGGGKSSQAGPRTLQSATALEAELRNWRSCLEAWIAAQRSYARALTGWILRCCTVADSGARSPLSPRRSAGGAPAMLGICMQWSQLLESVNEAPVMDGLDFFAAGIGTVSGAAQQRKEDGGAQAVDDGAGMPAVTAELAGKVLCAGMSVAVSSLAEFAVRSSEGYEALVKRSGPAEES